MMVHVIKDVETGNYVSSDSVFFTKDEIIYTTHTGRATGIEYSNTIDTVSKILDNIRNKLKSHGIIKELKAIEINKEDIPYGKMFKQYFPKVSNVKYN